MIKLFARLWIFAPVVLMFAPAPAEAFKFSPIEMVFAPAGRGATRTFQITNAHDQPIAVEIRIAARDMSLSGEDVLGDAEDSFVVFPAQALVLPGKSQSVRVQWIGDPSPERELAFRMLVEQLPIDLVREPGDGARLKLLVRYIASLYVAPRGVKAEVVLESAGRKTAAGGGAMLAVVLRNRGTAHSLLRRLTLTVTGQARSGGEVSVALTAEQLDGMIGQNLLAGHRREFLLPWPAKLSDGPVAVSFDYAR